MVFFLFSFFLFIEYFFLCWNLTEEGVFFQILFFILVFLMVEGFRIRLFSKEQFVINKYLLGLSVFFFNLNLSFKLKLFRNKILQICYYVSTFSFFKKLTLILSSF
jgi:hypothetical protein